MKLADIQLIKNKLKNRASFTIFDFKNNIFSKRNINYLN